MPAGLKPASHQELPDRAALGTRPEAKPSLAVILVTWAGIALVLAGLLACYLVTSKRLAGELGLPLDDGWIHARFAQNLARGLGFSFNPGEPTSTTTGPLWTLLLAGAYRVTGEHLFTSIAINYALSLLLLGAVYQLSLVLFSRYWVALCTALVAAVTVPLPWWALSGMEPPLYALLALLGIVLHIQMRSSIRVGQELASCPGGTSRTRFACAQRNLGPILPTISFALAGLARPEMLLLFPLSMLDLLVVSVLERRKCPVAQWLKGLALHAPLFAALVSPLFVYNYRVTGYPLPTSFYSKLQWLGISGALVDPRVSWSAALAGGPARELWEILKLWGGDNCVLLAPFLLGFAWLVWRPLSGDKRGPRSVLIPLVLVVQPVAWALVGGYRPPGYQSQRYLADLNVLFIVVAMGGGWWIADRLPSLRRPVARAALLGTVLIASLIRQPDGWQTYAMNVKNTTQMQVAIGRWLQTNAPADSLLAVNDIGAIGFISNMRVLDLQGLVTPEILSRRDMRRRLSGDAPQAVFTFIAERRPDYLIIFPQWYPELDQRRDLFTPVFGVALEDNVTNGAPLMVVYRTAWASRPGQETGRTP